MADHLDPHDVPDDGIDPADEAVVRRALADAVADVEADDAVHARALARSGPSRRPVLVAAALLALVGLAGAVVIFLGRDDDPAVTIQAGTSTTAPTDPSTTAATTTTTPPVADVAWEPRSSPPPSQVGNPDVMTVWTGEEVIVWGEAGSTIPGADNRAGAAWDPDTDTWRELPPSPVEARTVGGVWTGTEVVTGPAERVGSPGSWVYAAYNPAADRWRIIGPANPEHGDPTLWTGTRIVLSSNMYTPSFRTLDPDSGEVADIPVPPVRNQIPSRPFGGAWVELLDDGRLLAGNSSQSLEGTISVSDTEFTTWTEVDHYESDGLLGRVWTGSELLLLKQNPLDPTEDLSLTSWTLDGRQTEHRSIQRSDVNTQTIPVWVDGNLWVGDAVWDRSTDTWQKVPTLPEPPVGERFNTIVVPAGDRLLAFGSTTLCRFPPPTGCIEGAPIEGAWELRFE